MNFNRDYMAYREIHEESKHEKILEGSRQHSITSL